MSANIEPTRSIKTTIEKFRLANSGARIPFGVGCAWLHEGYPDRKRVKEHLLTYEMTYEIGFRYYDSARAYGNSEWVLGEFVATVPRDSIFVATKFNLYKAKTVPDGIELAKKCLAESLMRLKTGYIDLYQVHDSQNMDILFPEGGVLEFLLEARRQGLIRNIGMAIRERRILEQAVRHPEFASILTWGEFSPFNQDAADMIRRAAQRQMAVINGSPLYEARIRGLDFADPDVLAAVLQYPVTNPGIDMTLTGPSNRAEIQATLQALHRQVDQGLWQEWNKPAA
jgi:aryl-alcohol dehydrogenase-like predicted oxidoreductase